MINVTENKKIDFLIELMSESCKFKLESPILYQNYFEEFIDIKNTSYSMLRGTEERNKYIGK